MAYYLRFGSKKRHNFIFNVGSTIMINLLGSLRPVGRDEAMD